MNRRTTLKLMLAGATAPLAGVWAKSKAQGAHLTTLARMPAIFAAHGSPLLLTDQLWMDELHRWAQAMPRPEAILMLSAHWLDRPLTIGATKTVPLVYDFYGFPPEYYQTTYAAPGAPGLAKRVRELLGPRGPMAEAPERGLDHGAYVPLVAMYPRADVPDLQISVPALEPGPLLELGRALAPLRREGVLIFGSGFITHNLRLLDRGPHPVTPPWAFEFDAWAADVLLRKDADALMSYRQTAPGVRQALPTHEHFVPSIVTMGAAMDEAQPVSFPITGFMAGTFTKRSVQYG